MKIKFKFVWLAVVASLTYATHVEEMTNRFPVLKGVQLVSEAEAVLGVRRRTRRRTAVIVHSADTAQAQQQAAAVAATAPPPAPAVAPAAAPAPAPAQPAGAPPLGSIVTVLPDGCTTQAISGVQYNNCGGVYYRTAFQGNNLVYVVAQP